MNFSVLSLSVLSVLLLASTADAKFDGTFEFKKMDLKLKKK
jgi:hypothetical protein